MKIQESSEDYLKTMLLLEREHGYIKSIDIAETLGVSKPSVSVAVKKLRERGYISMEPNGPIELTTPGRVIAERTLERHEAILQFLKLMGVEHELADEDACRMEHVISNDTYLAFCKYLETHSDENID